MKETKNGMIGKVDRILHKRVTHGAMLTFIFYVIALDN